MIKVQEIIDAFESDDKSAFPSLIEDLPNDPMKSVSLSIAAAETPIVRLTAIDTLATAYTAGGSVAQGVEVAEACYRLGRKLFESQGPGIADSNLLTTGRAVWSLMSGLQKLGRHEKLVTFADG